MFEARGTKEQRFPGQAGVRSGHLAQPVRGADILGRVADGRHGGYDFSAAALIFLEKLLLVKLPPSQQVPRPRLVAYRMMVSIP